MPGRKHFVVAEAVLEQNENGIQWKSETLDIERYRAKGYTRLMICLVK